MFTGPLSFHHGRIECPLHAPCFFHARDQFRHTSNRKYLNSDLLLLSQESSIPSPCCCTPDKVMLHICIVLTKAITISALTLQLSQPISQAKSNSTTNLALPNGPQEPVDDSVLSNLSDALTLIRDGTIALPTNEPYTSIPYPPSSDPSQSLNTTSISTFNTLPPLPSDWQISCSEKLGTDMRPGSCLDAWTFMLPIEKEVSFGPRSAAETYDVELPRRFLSSMTLECILFRHHADDFTKPMVHASSSLH